MKPASLAIVLLLLIAAGLLHGKTTDRWGPPVSLLQTGQRLEALPDEIAGWLARHETVDDRMREASGAVTIISRAYENPLDGDVVRIMIVFGRPGPVSRHPPTVCFPAGGLQQATAVQRAEYAPTTNMSRCVFASGPANAMQTSWAWSSDGATWSSPDDPRLEFAYKSYLYKLYVLAPVGADRSTDTLATGSRSEFLAALLTELKLLAGPGR